MGNKVYMRFILIAVYSAPTKWSSRWLERPVAYRAPWSIVRWNNLWKLTIGRENCTFMGSLWMHNGRVEAEWRWLSSEGPNQRIYRTVLKKQLNLHVYRGILWAKKRPLCCFKWDIKQLHGCDSWCLNFRVYDGLAFSCSRCGSALSIIVIQAKIHKCINSCKHKYSNPCVYTDINTHTVTYSSRRTPYTCQKG